MSSAGLGVWDQFVTACSVSKHHLGHASPVLTDALSLQEAEMGHTEKTGRSGRGSRHTETLGRCRGQWQAVGWDGPGLGREGPGELALEWTLPD